MSEVNEGWIRGPFDESQVRSILGLLFSVSKRFGVTQSDKVRPTDDMSESLVHAACCLRFNLQVK